MMIRADALRWLSGRTTAQLQLNWSVLPLVYRHKYLHCFAFQHGPPASFPLPRPSISITAHAENGRINIRIPRSFNGPISITTANVSTKFSSETSAAVTTFSYMKTRKCFMGDYSTYRDDEPWTGDEAVIEAKNGSVKIQYDDEVAPESDFLKTGLFSFWGKLFGM